MCDTLDWRQTLTTIEEAAAAVAQRDPEIAAQLREMIAWLQTGDGSRCALTSLGGVERIRGVTGQLRALA